MQYDQIGKLLDDMECPNDAANKVLPWAHQVYVDGFDFAPYASIRKSNIT